MTFDKLTNAVSKSVSYHLSNGKTLSDLDRCRTDTSQQAHCQTMCPLFNQWLINHEAMEARASGPQFLGQKIGPHSRIGPDLLLKVLIFNMPEIWSFDSQKNCCHQMSDFKAKMHQIRFRLGLWPRPRWGAYSAPPDLLAGFKGLLLRGGRDRGGLIGSGK